MFCHVGLVGGVEGGCAVHLAVEFCAVVILLTC